MATLYYNNAAADGDLGNILNWWTDAGFTTPGTVPTTGDTAVVTVSAGANTAGLCAPTNLNLVNDGNFTATIVVIAAVVISGSQAFSTGANVTAATIAVNDIGSIGDGTVVGDVTVNSNIPTAVSGGSITGNLTYAGNYADTFPATAATVSGTTSITGSVTFSSFGNSATPSATTSAATITFNSQNNSGDFTAASIAFTGTGANSGHLTGPVSMVNGSNTGTVTGALTITGTGTNNGGTVTGLLTVPGTQAGTKITSNLAFADIGTFGTLAISGIAASGGGIRRLPQGFGF